MSNHKETTDQVEHHKGTGLGELLNLEEGRKRLGDYAQMAPNGDTLIEMPNITRVELIDYGLGGGVYSNWAAREVAISIQDDARTLKVFVKGATDEQEPTRLRNRAAELIRQAEVLERRQR